MRRLWNRKQSKTGGSSRFFLVCLAHDNLVSHFKTNFALMQHHNYSLSDLENMIPWEREVYLTLLADHLEKEAEENKKQEEQMLMFSVRLANEIVAEKTCIIVCAFINFVKFVPTIHSTDTITLFAVIFFFTELIADALLVYVLVEYFAVPMLRLPVEKFEWRSVEFWSGVMEVALIPVGATLFFLHAFISSNEWLA